MAQTDRNIFSFPSPPKSGFPSFEGLLGDGESKTQQSSFIIAKRKEKRKEKKRKEKRGKKKKKKKEKEKTYLQNILKNLNTLVLIKVITLHISKNLRGLQKSNTTTRNNTTSNSSLSSIKSILNTVLLLSNLNFGSTTTVDNSNTTRKLSKTLLKLALLVLRGGSIKKLTNKFLTVLNSLLITRSLGDNGVVLGDFDGLGGTEVRDLEVIKLQTELIRNNLSAGLDGDINHVGLTVVTEAGGLDGTDLETTVHLVQEEGGEGITFNVLGDDQQLAVLLADLFQDAEETITLADMGELALNNEDQGVLELALLLLLVGHEVRGDHTLVKLETLGDLDNILEGLAILHGDNTIGTDSLHGGSNEVSELVVVVG